MRNVKGRLPLVAVVVSSGALLAGSAFATEPTFDNHLQSTTMVSPAQLYQIDAVKTDFQLSYTSQEMNYKAEGAKELTATTKNTGLFAAGVYNFANLGLRAGLSVDYGSANLEQENFVSATQIVKEKADETVTVIKPQIAYPVGPVVFGAALAVVQKEQDWKDTDTKLKTSYNRPEVGALFAHDALEAGVDYRSAIHINGDMDDELGEELPATVILHGRYALNDGLSVGGMVENYHYKGIDEDTRKDRNVLRGTVEYGVNAFEVEGDLAWKSAYHKNDAAMDNSTISTIALGGAADYAVNEKTRVGGVLGYEFGKDSAKGQDFKKNELTVGVRGNMRF